MVGMGNTYWSEMAPVLVSVMSVSLVSILFSVSTFGKTGTPV